jgi:hypothetical protein
MIGYLVGVVVSVHLVHNIFFFLSSSFSNSANFIIASLNGFSFSIAGDGGDGLGEHKLLIPLDDSTIIDWTNLLLKRIVIF